MSKELELSVNKLGSQVDYLTKQMTLMTQQIGKMGDILTKLTTIELKSAELEKDLDGYGARMSKFETKVSSLEIKSAVQAVKGAATSKWTERIITFIVIAALGSWKFFGD